MNGPSWSDGTCSFFASFEECAGHCQNSGCMNDALQNKQWKVVQVFNTKVVRGKGLQSTEDLPAGTLVLEYVGQVVHMSHVVIVGGGVPKL